MKNLLTIAGSDCSGGAGIQADIKTFCAHGAFAMSVIVSVVAENTSEVISIHDMPAKMIADQCDAVFNDINVDGVKVGMMSGTEQMNIVAEKLAFYSPENKVIDTVMFAKGGHALMHSDCVDVFIEKLVPLADILTPNIPEAEALTSRTIKNLDDMKKACIDIKKMGAKNVLLKGGHLEDSATDILFDGDSFYTFEQKRINTKNTHGTGCTLSSAICANLANGQSVYDAVLNAKAYVTMAIEHSLNIGKGHGPTNHFYQLYKDGGII